MRHLLLAFLLTSSLSAETLISWKRQQLHGDFYSEGAGIGDINGDGKPDVVSGPFWWEGPAFEKKHAYYTPKIFSINGYSDNFFAYVHDFNADAKNDILILGFPGKEARLYLNPGVHDDKPWPMHIVADVVDNESPVFKDITGDGKPELVCSTGGRFGWFAPNWDKPTEKWPFVAISEDMKVAKFTHGLGVGDVNGDGKQDLLEARRWWEHTDSGLWTQHNFAAGVGGGAQMFAYDFDGNGTNDVFTSLAAHRYGVAVYMQNKPTPNQPTWKRVLLASENPADNDYGIVFSQPHAAYLADINGDGIQDIVTGKRYWAHNGNDPDERGARVVYWYETKRDGKGGVDFVPHLVDSESGVGVDVQVGDVNGDKLPDIVVGNKAGVFILTQVRTDSTADLTPRKMYGPALKPQSEYANGRSAQDALKNIQLPGGFKADLVISEPDLVQPIAFTFDERGRIWVIEGNSYPQPRAVGAGKDRILILEDKNSDGTYETKKVFCDGINLASGIELGFGGVWVGAAPYLMFIPDKDRDDKPDTADVTRTQALVPGLNFTAYALLDGWGSQDTHETLNSFIWGPDGWLYGCHGVFTHSKVGKPGAPDDQRQPINAGVWRYHPTRHVFEVFAHGTSNPWGLDYDQNGEFFVTACVIPHLYHIVPGARYHRQGGQHFNPHTYEDIETIADHAHYAGNIRDNAHWGGRDGGSLVQDDTNAAGGGHAHCGLAIYQSNHFPPTYRNKLIFGNLHGHRLVTDYTDPFKSTYVGKHGSDFMRSNDMNFIPVTQKVGPDGALYVSDWSDKQICHRGSNAVELWDRSNGRIYRVSYAGWKPWKGDLRKESDESLAKLAVQTDNEWLSRMARRVLMERMIADGENWQQATLTVSGKRQELQDILDRMNAGVGVKSDPRLLWLRYTLGMIRASEFNASLLDLPEHLKIWMIRYVGEYPDTLSGNRAELVSGDPFVNKSDLKKEFRLVGEPSLTAPKGMQYYVLLWNELAPIIQQLADRNSSPNVRRELSSTLQRLHLRDRKDLAAALLAHGEDKDDPYIPLLIWYGIEPLVGADPKAGLELAKASKMPKVTEFIYRRMGAEEAGRTGLLTLAFETKDEAQRDMLLATVVKAARSGNKITTPPNWAELKAKVGSTSVESKTSAAVLELEAFMGIAEAKQTFRTRLVNASLPPAQREAALTLLLNIRDPDAAPLLIQLVKANDPTLTRRAIQGLSTLAHPDTATLLTGKFTSFDAATQQDVINTLATNVTGATALLNAVKEKTIPSTLLSPFLARQIAALKSSEVDALLKETFGDLNAPKPDLEQRKNKFRALLKPADISKADKAKGKLLFSAVCGSCHQMFGEGQKVGPDLTGSNRANLDYLLDNVLDPNAVIGKDYQLNIFELNDGRLASGVVKEESAAAYRIALPGGLEQTITTAEVKKRTVAKVSTMPEGLFDALTPEALQQLVAYLQTNASPPKAAGSTAGTTAQVQGALEGETLKVLEAKGGSVKVQGMGGFGNKWSNGKQLWWAGAKPGGTLTLALPVTTKGKYKLTAALTKARDYGIIDVALDGKPVATGWDGFNFPTVLHSDELDWGTHDLEAGEHKLTFTITGANPQAVKSHMVGLDYVKLE